MELRAACGVTAVQTVTHLRTWRRAPYTLNYILLRDEPSTEQLLSTYVWALAEGLENPRVISPSVLSWSSLFQPTLYAAIAARGIGTAPIRFVGAAPENCSVGRLRVFWLQSIIFLAAVTLSAAIVQGRWSQGTIESKFDRLWQAASSAALPTEANAAALREEILRLAAVSQPPIELLLTIRRLFMGLVASLAEGIGADRVVAAAVSAIDETRFGFASRLAAELPGLTGVIVYGSSVTGSDYADIDAILVVEDAELVLRTLENKHLEWGAKS